MDELAKRNKLDAAFVKQWATLLAIQPRKNSAKTPAHVVSPLTLLDEKTRPNKQQAAILGWKKKGTDLPVVMANSSDQTLKIPGTVSGRAIAVHPTPQEFVAVVWKSPIKGTVRVAARVAHAHPACGNGVAWWLEHRNGDRGVLLGAGALDRGQEAKYGKSVPVEKGDLLVLAVDPRDGDHACDLTEVGLTVTQEDKPNRVWDLAKDVSGDVQTGNPHADKQGNPEVWTFARGPAKKPGKIQTPTVPVNSVLGRWREAAADPEQKAEMEKLSKEVESVMTGPRPRERQGRESPSVRSNSSPWTARSSLALICRKSRRDIRIGRSSVCRKSSSPGRMATA